jgi:hypothetical protein
MHERKELNPSLCLNKGPNQLLGREPGETTRGNTAIQGARTVLKLFQLVEHRKTSVPSAVELPLQFDRSFTKMAQRRLPDTVNPYRQMISAYDPTTRSGGRLSQKWKVLFHKERKVFVEDVSGVAISHRAVRLRVLQKMLTQAEKNENFALMADLLERAAKETSNFYSRNFKAVVDHSYHPPQDSVPAEDRPRSLRRSWPRVGR